MSKIEIRVETVDRFFERGRKLAKAADREVRVPASKVIAFERIEDLLSLLTPKRVLLIKQVKETPSSISMLARTLNRDRSAVTRDVQVLERFGVVRVTEKTLPGHGKQKWVAPLASEIKLTAVL
jgi:predicted transcriptional regulator